jgi:hypothetical protein
MHVMQTWLRYKSKWIFLSNELSHFYICCTFHFLMMMKLFLLNWWPHESIWVAINSFSIILCCHQWTVWLGKISMSVYLSCNWWQSVSANNLDVNSTECMKCISLININVHACAQMIFFSWNVCYIDDRQAYRNSCYGLDLDLKWGTPYFSFCHWAWHLDWMV